MEARIVFVLFAIGSQRLGRRRFSINQKSFGKSRRGRVQAHRLAFQPKHAKMFGGALGEMNSIVRRGAEGIVARLKPVQTRKRKPTIWLEQVRFVLLTPGGEIPFPGSIGWRNRLFIECSD